MKVSVSLPGDDIQFLDDYAKKQGLESRSAALHRAVRMLRSAELSAAYESAWEHWTADGDAERWEIDPRRRAFRLIRRGEIHEVNLDPVRGSEANKRRPGVIVSNDAANLTADRLGRGVITIVPVTSNIETLYPFQVLLPAADTGLARDSKAQAEQVRSVAVERVGARLGVVPRAIMLKIDEALRLHLDL